MQKAKEILTVGGILMLITLVAGLLLSGVNLLTRDIIAETREEEAIAAMQEVLPIASDFEALDEEEVLHVGKKDGEIVGYTASVSPQGYGGEINMMVGLDKDGAVTGVRIISMSETAGLGSKTNDPAFLEQYIGKNQEVSLATSSPDANEVAGISGATVSSKAVTRGVSDAIVMVQKAIKEGVQ